MSYCRWSSNDFDCDLYCYEDVGGGFTTHVAGNRIVGDIPKLLPWGTSTIEEWSDAYSAQMEWLETCERKDIGLPHDGESFNDPDLESFLERIQGLRALGYHCPGDVDESIRAEMAECLSADEDAA